MYGNCWHFILFLSEIVISPAICQAIKTGELNVYLIVVFSSLEI